VFKERVAQERGSASSQPEAGLRPVPRAADCISVVLTPVSTGDPYQEVTSMGTPTAERPVGLADIGLDRQNKATLGRVLGTGPVGRAEEGADGRMHARVRIPPDELIWDPSILVMPHAGDLDLELVNDDTNTHCALLPSNGDNKWMWLPVYSRGMVTLNLDGPGYYWFSSNIGNDEGRGLIGAIVVLGDAPPEARLDRPEQPRP
jgi:PQQ system protein